jgi:hypothetical protein
MSAPVGRDGRVGNIESNVASTRKGFVVKVHEKIQIAAPDFATTKNYAGPSGFSLDQPLILVMGTDPDPDEVRAVLHGDGTVIDPDPCGPQFPNLLEVQGGVSGVRLQQREVLAGDSLDGFG